MKKYSFIITVLSVFFFACDNDSQLSKKPWNPGPIEEYTVTPINGGAIVTYIIPNDPDILYVMAEYERNGKIFTEKSSVHNNSLTIEGFHRVEKVKATLYKVNKLDQRSEPVVLAFEPLESLISIAQNSLSMVPGFGGIIATWDNPSATEFGVCLMVEDEEANKELVTKEMYYSTMKSEKHAFRGFEAAKTTFAITFEDKWGNISDTTSATITPLFEAVVPKPYADFRANIPYDNISNLGSRNIATLWDNIVNTASHGWLTNPGNSGLSITFDLKQEVKLSRIIIHGYHHNSIYGQVNITQFELWGIHAIDYDKLKNLPYWLDEQSVRWGAIKGVDATTELPVRTFKDDWEYLGWHAIPRYDLMVPVDRQAILNLAANGTEYEMPIDAKPVRYIRLFVREIVGVMPPPSNNYFSMGEITFYGDNTVK